MEFNYVERKIAVVGLGYVGLPLAVEFGKKFPTIGLDISLKRIEELKKLNDITGETSKEELESTNVEYTNDFQKLKEASFIIVTVPTPIDVSKQPDLTPVKSASKTVGKSLSKGSIVVFESTVYPGVTEEVCVPILESESGLICGVDFKVGYSPERINPGDKEHTVTKILKVVSGQDNQSLDIISATYETIIIAGVHKAESIKVAEAAKVIENTQRDLNIALMNELAIIFNNLGIDTRAVLEAAGTKWNFIKMFPGLVGGHCIGVDPYYLTHKAEQSGYHPQVILAGRRINDGMGKYVAEQTVKNMIKAGTPVKDSNILIAGFTFKENVSDLRNTKVIDVVKELEEYGVNVYVYDPMVNPKDAMHEYKQRVINNINEIPLVDSFILAVAHKEIIQKEMDQLFCKLKGEVFIDIKGVFRKDKKITDNYVYWSL